ncbi:hypothetical protein [Flavobacterium tyrosinilyticum]|uniref:hypothetical protein n=1 Tax=Flavobacterium tyrosinilyticum TaxID=1658740 RepID=UPI00202FF05F|nr:hypothetical protein [Flavobacterium tyrosinilyticum]MCM0667559.1 hypothetical protein [Flavobacterium tyrosinilyticum]
MLKIDEYKIIRDFIKKKSLLLMDHEKKNHARTGIAINNYRTTEINGKIYYLIPTNLFTAIVDRYLGIASAKYPNQFGTGNANDVIKAIYDLEPWFDLNRFNEILKTEQFCYVVEVKDGVINKKLLRIDLYRDIKENKNGGFDFVGGVFHCYKHFSYEGNPLSTSKEINDIKHPSVLIFKIITAFFQGDVTVVDKFTSYSEVEINNNEKLKLVFYYEQNTEVFFVKTVHRI